MAHQSIWERKSRVRKYISLKNNNIAIIEHVKEKHDITFDEAVDILLEHPEERSQAVEELKEYYYDFQ